MKNFKFLIIIVILLVIINCVLLGSLWFTKYHMVGPPIGGPPERANEYLIRELKMTPAQVKQYDAMRKQHFEATQKLNDQNRLLRDEFFEHIQTPVLNKASVDSLQKKISANSVTLDTTTLYHFRKLRTILTNEQKTKFDKIIQNALHMMGGPQKGGAGPGGPPPGGMRPEDGAPGKNAMHPPRGQRPGMHPPPGGGPPPLRPDGSRPDGPPDGMRPPPPGGGPPPDRDFMPPPGGPRPGMPPPPGGGPGMPPPGY